MRKKTKGLGVLIFFALLVLLICIGKSNSSKSSSSKSTSGESTIQSKDSKAQTKEFYNVGEAAKAKDVQITAEKISKSAGSEFDKPKDGMEFVIVTVKIKNCGNSKISYNPLYFKMQNSKGQISDCTYSVNSNTELQSGDLAAGGEVEGSITFEEPTGDKKLILQYQDDAFSNDVKLQFKLN